MSSTPGHIARRPRRRRRGLVALAVMASAVLAVPVIAVTVAWLSADRSNVGRVKFERALPIPPLLEPESDGTGVKVFDLRMQAGVSELVSGQQTPTWGFNGAYLGPTLRAARGERVSVRVTNALPEATTVHWHGMHLPAEADGGPHQPIAPGKTWKPRWRIDQPAASLWYHPHLHGDTEEHVYRGLAGMFIVDNPAASALPLPDTYGVDDVPVIVQDKNFKDDGELSFAKGMVSPIGQLGDTIVVNGAASPHFDVTSEATRLRLLNASAARTYNFGFSDRRRFDLVATGGGMLAAPRRIDQIQLSPGERAEIVVRLMPGEAVVLRSSEPELGDLNFIDARFSGAHDTFDVLELRAADRLRDSPATPSALVPAQPLAAAPGAPVRRFELTGRKINGRKLNMDRIDQAVPVDTTEIWELENRAGIPHNFHAHDTRFRVLEYAGAAPGPTLTGLKDTVLVPANSSVRVAIRFGDYADPDAPYMFHCHLLKHEDQGMMGQFVVVKPGEPPDAPADGGHPGR